MSGPEKYAPKSALAGAMHSFELNAIALILGAMTVITFVNVVLRYLFNTSLIWGLEVVLMLFAWLVIFGISHAFKITAHLGVDAVTNLLKGGPKKLVALGSAAACLLYALLLLKGSWDYWAPFAGSYQTTGRWFPTGIDWGTRDRAFYITEQIPMPGILRFLEGWINQGEVYDKLPRVVPYIMLPIGFALLVWRLVQATVDLVQNRRESLIVSHEAEDAVEEVAALNRGA